MGKAESVAGYPAMRVVHFSGRPFPMALRKRNSKELPCESRSGEDCRRLFQVPQQDRAGGRSGGAARLLAAAESHNGRTLHGCESLPGGAGDTTIPGIAHVKKPVANLSASVRQRLLNLATERKEDFGLVLT